jgi:hypothetical protein
MTMTMRRRQQPTSPRLLREVQRNITKTATTPKKKKAPLHLRPQQHLRPQHLLWPEEEEEEEEEEEGAAEGAEGEEEGEGAAVALLLKPKLFQPDLQLQPHLCFYAATMKQLQRSLDVALVLKLLGWTRN